MVEGNSLPCGNIKQNGNRQGKNVLTNSLFAIELSRLEKNIKSKENEKIKPKTNSFE